MKKIVTTLPSLPGVYLFKNDQQEVIYIGKAKNLKKRVTSYFYNKTKDWKIDALLDEVNTIDHIITHSEHEALLLEADLIQEHQPKFNVLLKSGQPFVYLIFSQETLPQCKIVRNKKTKGFYFGPFIHKQHARRVYDFIMKTFQLYTCNKKIDQGCLHYHIGMCAGTCKKDFVSSEYIFRIELAKALLKKDYKKFTKNITEKIQEYNTQKLFEKARNFYEYQKDLQILIQTLAHRYNPTHYLTESIAVTTQKPLLQEDYQTTAQALKMLLNLSCLPETIDCFDISHFQSTALVGSCIRFSQGKPDKNKFRRFKIKTLVEQNDYAALQEIVQRRYKDADDIPDLVLIDGGKGQRNAILPFIPSEKCISLAKKEELLFSNIHPEGTPLDLHTRAGKLLIALRDYAHHFAITYHRKLRHFKQKG